MEIERLINSIRKNQVRITKHTYEETDQIGPKGKNDMTPFEKCSVCGGILYEKEIEKTLKEGTHPAVLRVVTEVCTHCGA